MSASASSSNSAASYDFEANARAECEQQTEVENEIAETLWEHAMYANEKEFKEIITKSYSNLRLSSKDYQTILMAAVQSLNSQSLSIVDILLEFDADPNKRDYIGNTALHYAVESGNCEVVKSLISAKACINAQNIEGYTPLISATRISNARKSSSRAAVIEVLLIFNADPLITDCSGRNALHYAESCDFAEAQSLLVTAINKRILEQPDQIAYGVEVQSIIDDVLSRSDEHVKKILELQTQASETECELNHTLHELWEREDLLQEKDEELNEMNEQLLQKNAELLKKDSEIQQMQAKIKQLKRQLKQNQMAFSASQVAKKIGCESCAKLLLNDNPIITYTRLQELGEGAYGKVYKIRTQSGHTLAVKVLKSCRQNFSMILENLHQEEQRLRHLQHQHIVMFVKSQNIDDRLEIFTEYVHGRCLTEVIDGCPLDEYYIRRYSKQICEALCYLHSQEPPVIHRDIKPENVMIEDETDIVKLIDFGLAVEIKSENMTSESIAHMTDSVNGTQNYLPPEVVTTQKSGVIYSRRSDVWALGATVYYMATGSAPFKDKNYFQIHQKLYILKEVPQLPSHSSDQLKEFYGKCACYLRKDRLLACELLKLPFFENDSQNSDN